MRRVFRELPFSSFYLLSGFSFSRSSFCCRRNAFRCTAGTFRCRASSFSSSPLTSCRFRLTSCHLQSYFSCPVSGFSCFPVSFRYSAGSFRCLRNNSVKPLFTFCFPPVPVLDPRGTNGYAPWIISLRLQAKRWINPQLCVPAGTRRKTPDG